MITSLTIIVTLFLCACFALGLTRYALPGLLAAGMAYLLAIMLIA
jgi:hypothetical protein